MKYLVVLVSVLILSSCRRDQAQVARYDWDPYLESFKGKNIRYLVSTHYADSLGVRVDSLIDSIEFNKAGYMIGKKMLGREILMAYDSLGRLNHILTEGETYSNISYAYEFQDSVMVRYGFEIKHLDWIFDKMDVDSSTQSVMRYRFNSNGQIEEQRDQTGEMVVRFSYDGKKLMKREFFSDGRLYIYWEYFYKNGTLLKVAEHDVIDHLVIVDYFSPEGLLLRTERIHGGPDSTIQETAHRYVYY